MSGTGRALRAAFADSRQVVAPGAFNALFAKMVEEAGFEALYVSGAGIANSMLGRPDVGLTTLTETAFVVERIADVVSLPLVVDADTGYGGIGNVARTVRTLERAGAAAIQIEDQVNPKRCGHFADKQVVEVAEMQERLAAALDARGDPGTVIIARTDALATHGMDEVLARCERYRDAGADVLFVDAPRSREEFATIGRELAGIPLMANMVEFARSPLLDVGDLAELGFALVIFPGSITRLVTRAARLLLAELASAGTTAGALDRMASFDEVNDLVGRPAWSRWEAEIGERAAGGSGRPARLDPAANRPVVPPGGNGRTDG